MGDDACWMAMTCLSCGRFMDEQAPTAEEAADQPAEEGKCPFCGAERIPSASPTVDVGTARRQPPRRR